jgi:ParB-like chromosome segregation protein Spo0J
LRSVGVTVEELEAATAIIPGGFAAMARTGHRPTADAFRALIASRPSTRPIRMGAHRFAALIPEMTPRDLKALSEDIKQNGLHDPIITFEGKILDGRHRYQACQMVGVEPRFEEFAGTDPIAFVISKNLHRRHLTSSQRAVIANDMATMPLGTNQHASIEAPSQSAAGACDIPPHVSIDTPSQSEAAKLMDVSRLQVAKARRVEREAPELIEPIRHGEMTINAALEKIKPAKTEAATRGTLHETASSPEAVQRIVAAAAEAANPRDRLLAIAEILASFPDRALRRKCVSYLANQYCR